MIFRDNVIKKYLENVYFLTGTPYGGKTIVSRELARRHDLLVFDIDAKFERHRPPVCQEAVVDCELLIYCPFCKSEYENRLCIGGSFLRTQAV